MIWSSPIALFASEMAGEAGMPRRRASGVLFRPTGRTPPPVMRRGWRRRTASGSAGEFVDGEGSPFSV